MSTDAQGLIEAFDSLEPGEQRIVAAEILRRTYGTDELSDAAFSELAAEVFHGYDAFSSDGMKQLRTNTRI